MVGILSNNALGKRNLNVTCSAQPCHFAAPFLDKTTNFAETRKFGKKTQVYDGLQGRQTNSWGKALGDLAVHGQME